ncbi:DALR anticodon-binding domain-containing protein [Planotetraspora sp. A-T 1434]|uniref:DALR anticodon-binding domain-containing protein n=1 Tax=Planotetraspora sp. A-T 1434 TaxID=2979219 RepID=UPI0021BE49C3|nr:DALR anticodon-binding domain-containing protein [Planotetraspora sp. A-T 1434]MCT9929053.1 DALR anticodon-binding domain-containing protein [Planotetraspora sp. A-T 1434]
MTPARLGRFLGAPPVPCGSWEREAVLASPIALKTAYGRPPRDVAEEFAARLRGEEGIAAVRVQPNGFLLIALATPGEIVREIVEPESVSPPDEPDGAGSDGPAGNDRRRAGRVPSPWPDFPRTWDNPGFVVRFAHARAAVVRRWARDLGVPSEGFRPELLDDPRDRAVLRLLAELPSRTAGREPAWTAYAEQLALAYHDAHEHAPATPMGDGRPAEVHTSRLWLARAVQIVLVDILGTALPDRL